MQTMARSAQRNPFVAKWRDWLLWLCIIVAMVFVVLMVAAFTPAP